MTLAGLWFSPVHTHRPFPAGWIVCLDDLVLDAFVYHGASLRLAVDPHDKTLPAPKFYRVTVEKVPGPTYGIRSVRTDERAMRYEVISVAARVSSILLHSHLYNGWFCRSVRCPTHPRVLLTRPISPFSRGENSVSLHRPCNRMPSTRACKSNPRREVILRAESGTIFD